MHRLLALYALLIILFCTELVCAMSLKDAVQSSVVSNPRVLRTVKVCLANEQAHKGAMGGYYPALNARGEVGYEHSKSSSTVDAKDGHRTLLRKGVGLEARQMLFDGLATMQNVSRTRFKLNASAWSVSNSANDAALRLTEAYLNVLRQKELLKSASENVRIHERTNQMIERRSESGVSRNTDAVQSKGRLAQASSNKKTAQGHLKDAQIAFYRVAGFKPARLRMPRIKRNWVPRTSNRAVDQAIEYHPALRAANSDILEALAQHKGAKSTMFPQIDLVGDISYNTNLDGVKGDNNDRSIMLKGTWNLINGGRDFRRRRETAYLVQEAAEVRNNTYRQIVENTKLAWVAYKTNAGLQRDFKLHMDAARSTIDAYAKQFQLGQRTLLDLLNSENEYFSSKAIYVNTKYDLMLAKYRVIASMGLLNDSLDIDLSALGGNTHHLDGIMDYPNERRHRGHSHNHHKHGGHNNRHGHSDHKYHHRHSDSHKHHDHDRDTSYRKKSLWGKEGGDHHQHSSYASRDDHNHNQTQWHKEGYDEDDDYSHSRSHRAHNRDDSRHDGRRNRSFRRASHDFNEAREYRYSKRRSTKHASNKNYTIQLLGTTSESTVRKFMQRTGIRDMASYYKTERKDGEPWYILTYGKYNSRTAAVDAIADLPSDVAKHQPWPRTDESMQFAQMLYGAESESLFA